MDYICEKDIIQVAEQGSFFAGGAVRRESGHFDPYHHTSAGQTLHGDHAYVFYQIPKDAHKLPLVFLHGNMQSGKTWETTPDGREGFQNIFLRRGFGVYLIDQPRRGRAGKSVVGYSSLPVPDEQYEVFDIWRLGIWPDYFPGVQFDQDPQVFEQICRQCTPNTAEFDLDVVSSGVSAAINRVGDCILVTHSMGGGVGWFAALQSPGVKAIVAYEPGSNFVFPEGEVPEPMPSSGGPLSGVSVPMDQFMALTKMPIIIYFGDNIPATPCDNPGQDLWRVRLDMARIWADTVNKHGGNAKVVWLPEDCGIFGNTHFMFSDLNNRQIADLLSRFLHENGLD